MPLPSTHTAGDTLKSTISLGDYPASAGWVLSYRLVNADNNYAFNTTTNGNDFLVNVTYTSTSKWVPGEYIYQGSVILNGERYTVDEGTITILPNLKDISKGGVDVRSQSEIILDALMADYESRVKNNQGFVIEYQIAGRMMRFQKKSEWIKEINYWQSVVKKEKRDAKARNGQNASTKILFRF